MDVAPIHVRTGTGAAAEAAQLGARAFALGTDIVLGSSESESDLPLMAHEVAHVLQQQSAPRVQLWSPAAPDRYETEARHAAAAVVAGRRFVVRERTTPRPQRQSASQAPTGDADGRPEVTHVTVYPAPDGTKNDRKIVAVGEDVMFTTKDRGTWTATGGRIAAKKGGVRWTAPNRAASVNITLTTKSSASTATMKVIEPADSERATKISDVSYVPYAQGAGMKLTFAHHPTHVSFGNIRVCERVCEGKTWGDFDRESAENVRHYPEPGTTNEFGPWARSTVDNKTEEGTSDEASITGRWPTHGGYRVGGWAWFIPVHFAVVGETGHGKQFGEVWQVHFLGGPPTWTSGVYKARAWCWRAVPAPLRS